MSHSSGAPARNNARIYAHHLPGGALFAGTMMPAVTLLNSMTVARTRKRRATRTQAAGAACV